jgi:hypothetical protein
MKATIESNFNFNFYSIRIFAEILNAITTSKNEAELRKEMKRIKDSFLMTFSSYFDYGFGSNHMWVCEAGKKERLIFVEF